MTQPLSANVYKRDLRIVHASIAATLFCLTMLFASIAPKALAAWDVDRGLSMDAVILCAVALIVAYGNLLYQFCLHGNFKRKQAHAPAARERIEAVYDAGVNTPSLAFLIPAYKEERNVVRQTMLASALAEYPRKSVTLLIDDPYLPKTREDVAMLEGNRLIAPDLQALFDLPLKRYSEALNAFQQRVSGLGLNAKQELARLAGMYENVSAWMQSLEAYFLEGRCKESLPHAEAFFLDSIVAAGVKRHKETAADLLRMALGGGEVEHAFIERHYRRLKALFDVRFGSFERKKYANLSHDANKAMNLNSYIGLMGKHVTESEEGGKHYIRESFDSADGFFIPDADYLVILDADTTVLHDYCLRLAYEMDKPENARAAVIQTFPTAFPNCPDGIERMAGASIDMLFPVNQGHSYWNAGFWMGANALVRKRALEEIAQTHYEHGHPISVFIQDGTVIEDTETTAELMLKGWRVHNYPVRMAFFTSPPDFGSLLIQRRRWANGGLLLLPRLARYIGQSAKNTRLLKECMIRFDYMSSAALMNIAAIVMFFYPFDHALFTPWLAVFSLPCMLLQMHMLKKEGHRHSDIFRLYAFYMLLVPVILGGVLKSLQQAVTGKKIPFCRTPKIPSRTAAPALYALLEAVMPLAFILLACVSAMDGHWSRAAFSAVNAGFAAYALTCYVGIREVAEDILSAIQTRWRRITRTAEILPIPAMHHEAVMVVATAKAA